MQKQLLRETAFEAEETPQGTLQKAVMMVMLIIMIVRVMVHERPSMQVKIMAKAREKRQEHEVRERKGETEVGPSLVLSSCGETPASSSLD